MSTNTVLQLYPNKPAPIVPINVHAVMEQLSLDPKQFWQEGAEARVLGAFLTNPSEFWPYAHRITRAHFMRLGHQLLFDVLERRIVKDMSLEHEDVILDYAEYTKTFYGGLGKEKPTDAQIQIVFDAIVGAAQSARGMDESITRMERAFMFARDYAAIGDALSMLKSMAQNPSVTIADYADKMQTTLAAVGTYTDTQYTDMATVAKDFYNYIEKLVAGEVTGLIPTHNAELDTLLDGGLTVGECTILVGGAKRGKTTFALQMVLEYVKAIHKANPSAKSAALYVSMEMPARDLMFKLVEQETGVWSTTIKKNAMSTEQLTSVTNAVMEIASLPLELVYHPEYTPVMLTAKLNQLSAQGRLPRFIVLDGLWLMGTPTVVELSDYANRYKILTEQLNQIAQKFQVHILVLHQFAMKTIMNNEPSLQNLAGGESIGRNAANLFFLWRREEKTVLKVAACRNNTRAQDQELIYDYDKDRSRYVIGG
jgi:replicative DNA helicase